MQSGRGGSLIDVCCPGQWRRRKEVDCVRAAHKRGYVGSTKMEVNPGRERQQVEVGGREVGRLGRSGKADRQTGVASEQD